MLALLNGNATIITVYYWVAVLCSQSTGGSCNYVDVYQDIFTSEDACVNWIDREAKRYALKKCFSVRYTLDIGRSYQGEVSKD